jgi:HEAT repeat protein
MKRAVVLLAVAWALCWAGPVAAQPRSPFEDLLANLKSPSAGTRQQAASALGHSRRREAVAPLAAAINDPEPKVRLEVVRALRELRDVSGVPALVAAMKDPAPQIREEAIGTVVEVYAERERSGAVASFLEIFSDEYDRSSVQPFTNVDAGVYPALAEALRDEDRDIRRSAAYAIGILDGRSVVRDLVTVLQDPDPDVRGAAATAIGKIGGPEDGKALIPLLSDESTSVRNRTLQAIGVLKVRGAGPALREMYDANRRKDLGLRVLACLSRIGDPAQAGLFRELVEDPDPETRRLAVEGLGRVGDAGYLEGLKKDFQRERNDELKLSYAFALTLLGDRAFLDTIVLSLPSRTLGRRSRDYLLEMGRGILPDLYPYLSDPDATVRAELCDIIGASGEADAIGKLTPLVSDPSTKVADRANRAVERLRRISGSSGD